MRTNNPADVISRKGLKKSNSKLRFCDETPRLYERGAFRREKITLDFVFFFARLCVYPAQEGGYIW